MNQKVIGTNPTSVAIFAQSPILRYGIKDMLESLGHDHKINCFSEFQDFIKSRVTDRQIFRKIVF
ncbi:hypothetical protein SAMN05216327_1182 [Dyadobacter sp. SG02]|nr:hypothetical protein SAMN05216327_1182 [Dyadobacter sp. SG02]